MEFSEQDSLLLYYAVFSFSVFMSFIYQKKYQLKSTRENVTRGMKRKSFIMPIFIIAPVVALQTLRYRVGTDYYAYEVLYKSLTNEKNKIVYNQYVNEPLYIYESRLVKMIFNDVWGFFFLNALIEAVLIFVIFNHYKEKISMPIAYVLFYSMLYPTFFNMERQALALVIAWLGMIFFEKKEYVKYVLVILIAMGFHNSAIVFLIVGIFCRMESLIRFIRKYAGIFLFLIAGALIFMYYQGKMVLQWIIQNFSWLSKYKLYLANGSTRMSISYMLIILMTIPCIVYIKNLKNNEKFSRFYVVCFLTQVVFLIMSCSVNIGNRLFLYFENSQIILISMLCKSVTEGNRKFLSIAYILFGIIFFYSMYYNSRNSEIFPYRLILERFTTWH